MPVYVCVCMCGCACGDVCRCAVGGDSVHVYVVYVCVGVRVWMCAYVQMVATL